MLLNHAGREAPAVVVLTAMCAGILGFTGNYVMMSFCLLFLAMLSSFPLLGHVVLGVFIGCAAAFCAPDPLDIPEGEHFIQGEVKTSGFTRGNFRVVLENVSIDATRIRGLVLLNVLQEAREIEDGCRLKGTATFCPPRKLGNPGEFDFTRYLLTQGIVSSCMIRDFDSVTITESRPRDDLKSLLNRLLSNYARPEAEILKAVITGDRSGLVYSLQDAFASLGIMHLIAISGLHMGIVFFLAYLISFAALRVLAALTGRSFDSPLLAKISGLSCVVAYSLFVGYSPPTVRAAIMVAVLVMSLILKRKANLLESLSVAGIIILLWMPWSLCSVSFLLSFSAVLGITGLCQRWKSLPGWLKAVAVPIVSMAFTCPVAAYFFGFVSPVTIPANIIIVPLFSFIVMPLGFSGLALSQISEQLSSMAFSLAFMGIRLILSWAKSYGSLEPVSIFGLPWVLVSCFGLITAFFARSSRLVTVILTTCVIFIIAMPVCLRIISSSQGLSFDIISVGQGDSVLVTKNSCALLIDGGPAFSVSDAGRSIVAPYLIGNGVSQIDLAVITHAHPDHSGGMPFILEHFPVKNIITTSETTTNPSFMNVIRIAERKSIPVKCVSRGDVLHLAGTRIEVLNPPCRTGKFSEDLDQNLQSLVIRIVDDTMKGLFMADAAGLGEIRLSRLDQDITADVLKVAHHGTRNSCMDMFLDKVKPHAAVISVGQGNHYRLPSKLAIKRLRKRRICTYRTDIHGSISIKREKGCLRFKLGKTRTDKGFNEESARFD